MKGKFAGTFILLASSLLLGSGAWAQGATGVCTWPQIDPDDEIGASRTQTAEKVLQAIRLVKSGDVYRLAHDYDETEIPLPFGRVFDVTVLTGDLGVEPSQAFAVGSVTGEIGQVGTQFDAVGHAGHTSGFYNCIPRADLGPDTDGRLKKLGVETVRPFFTRGILLDFVNHSSAPKMTVDGRTMLVDSYLITLNDVREVMEIQGIAKPGVGDVVLFYTGWDSLFGVDNARFAFSPGPGTEVARWLASKNVALVGADTQSVEALENGVSVELVDDPGLFGENIGPIFNAVHFILITQNGIHLLEHMRLHQLAADLAADLETERDPFGPGSRKWRRGKKRGSPYEFLFTFAPVPIKGLAGSPGQPLAVR